MLSTQQSHNNQVTARSDEEFQRLDKDFARERAEAHSENLKLADIILDLKEQLRCQEREK